MRATVENIESIDTCLKNITTINLCFIDTSKKIFVENFELNVVETMIDIETNDFVEIGVIFEKIENETTTIDESSIIINDLKTVVDNFDDRSNFFFD